MERIEVNCATGEQRIIQLTDEEIAAIPPPVPIDPQIIINYLSSKVMERLKSFALEKDMIISEVDILKNSTNPTWAAEANEFSLLYIATWETFYAYTGTDWAELEASLPVLTWTE